MSKAPTPQAPKAPSKRQSKSTRPAHLPHGRWLGDFPRLSVAEKALVAACARGEVWAPKGWNGERPEKATAANTVRADLIRFLLLSGDAAHPVHELGVMLRGAWINGTLNLHQLQLELRLVARDCHFAEVPNFMNASLPELSLSGSHCPGLLADRLRVQGAVFLGDGFHASGEVRLLGADIGGNLHCSGGRFDKADGKALSADGVAVKGDVILSNKFHATGEVRLTGADIGGDLDCSGGHFDKADSFAVIADRVTVKGSVFLRDKFQANGAVRLLGADIGGNLDCSGGRFDKADGFALSADGVAVKGVVFLGDGFHATGKVRFPGADIDGTLNCSGGRFENADGDALSAEGVTVKGVLFLRDSTIESSINLTAARVGTLVDGGTLACWQGGQHILDGFRYDRIIGFTDAAQRTQWLQLQHEDHLTTEFKPQPWEQLIKILRDMGHDYDAGAIAIAKQVQMRKAGVIKGRWRQLLHWLYGHLAGYGHRPIQTVGWMAAVWLLCSLAYWAAADGFAAIGPANPVITSAALYPDAAELCGHGNEPGKARWTECSGVPDEYSTFQPFIYSLDLILPLVDLQQESDWAPIAEGPTGQDLPAGVVARWLMWFEILFGWAMSLMLVAVLGRLVDKD